MADGDLMIMPSSCMRCHTATTLERYGWLWLCPTCAPTHVVPVCLTHEWHGHAQGWLCYRCGVVLAHSPALDAGALDA